MKKIRMNKRVLFSGLGLAAVFAVVVVVVQAVSFVPGVRVDLTDDGLYTLADGTKSMLRGLEAPVKAEFFYSADLAQAVPQVGNYAQRVRELLREYARLSGGKLEVVDIDPEAFSEDEDRAAELGLVSVPIVAGGPEIFFGLALTGPGGKPEVIPFFRPDREDMLEQDLSQLVWKASRKTPPKIGLYAGLEVQGGFDFMTRQPSPPWMSIAQVEEMYTVEALPADFAAVPEDIRLLVLVHPVGLDEKALRAIDVYARGGGAVLVFVDPHAEQAGGPMGFGGETASDLAPLFKAWGVGYDASQALVDARLAVPVASNEYGRAVPHIGIQQFGPGEIGDDVATARLERVLASSAGVLRHVPDAKTTFTPLLVSSDQSMLVASGRFEMLDEHTKLYDGFQPSGEPQVVAARIGGILPSAYPAPAGEASAGPAVEAQPANIVVVADTDLLSDRLWVRVQDFMGQRIPTAFADNGDLAINLVDSLMGSAELMGIRGRGRHERPFDVVDRLEREAAMDLQAQQEELQARLDETEAKLAELESRKAQDAQAFELDEAQVAELEKFMEEKLRTRKALREVQHQLGSDIDQLGTWLKVLNILAAPLLLVLLVFFVARRVIARR